MAGERATPSVRAAQAAIRAGERRALARAITAIESTRADRRTRGQAILDGLLADTGGALRVGLTGPPGVGKSSFIEALGLHLLKDGARADEPASAGPARARADEPASAEHKGARAGESASAKHKGARAGKTATTEHKGARASTTAAAEREGARASEPASAKHKAARVAVLAVDPSSPVTGGSILGDKTRMERLAQDARAFIRPSPSGGALGGVAQRTREALLLCEAAGFDVVLVETVGIGQSEIAVRAMVDFFAVLLQPGAGDELQGIKKGAIELADALVVNKADGEQRALAERTRGEYEQALQLLRPGVRGAPGFAPRVLVASAASGEGIQEFWAVVQEQRAALEKSGELEARRRAQAKEWMWTLLREGLEQCFHADARVAARVAKLEARVEENKITPAAAARELLEVFRAK